MLLTMGLIRAAAFLSLALLCINVAVASIDAATPLVVKGRVYCDVCASGYFTKSSSYIEGAQVAVECTSKDGIPTLSTQGKTDSDGVFEITLHGDHENELCAARLVHSPSESCNVLTDRAVAPVHLIRNAGLAVNVITTGPFSYKPQEPVSACRSELLELTELPEGYYGSPSPTYKPSPEYKPSPSPSPEYKPSPSPSPEYKPSPSPS
eukprot:c39016_g1_i1 orf=1-621(-)